VAGGDDGARLRRLRGSLLAMHAAVLQRLDAEVSLLRSDIEAGFTAVRTRMADSAADLVRRGAVDHSAGGRRRLEQNVLDQLRRWADDREQDIRAQGVKAVAAGVGRLLDDATLDWEVANRLTPAPSGAYPHHLIAAVDGLTRRPLGSVSAVAAPAAPGLAPAPSHSRRNTLAAGGAVGGSVMTGQLPLATLPAAVVGGAAGFLAGKVWDRLEEPERQRALTEAAVSHARRIANDGWDASSAALTTLAQQVHAELHRRLEALETALDREADRCPPVGDRPDPAADDDLRALVALRARLALPDPARA
jgi:hypothetical protein